MRKSFPRIFRASAIGMSFLPRYRFPQQPLSQKPPEPEPKPLAMRHDVYYDMLSHLTLSPKHHNDLLSRGLSEERISQNMYRSLPSGTSARRLLAGMLSDFHDLEGIPGFYVDKDGFWNISGHSGLLVPYCTMDGYIQIGRASCRERV